MKDVQNCLLLFHRAPTDTEKTKIKIEKQRGKKLGAPREVCLIEINDD
jgi:hypothetical protein